MRRPITSRVHGLLDYPMGLALVAVPLIFGFGEHGEAAVAVPVVIGAMLLVQATITDYELSVENALPLPLHLAADVLAGVVLAASPWLFGFADDGVGAWLPHVVAGAALVASGLLTRRERAEGATVVPLPPQPPLHLR